MQHERVLSFCLSIALSLFASFLPIPTDTGTMMDSEKKCNRTVIEIDQNMSSMKSSKEETSNFEKPKSQTALEAESSAAGSSRATGCFSRRDKVTDILDKQSPTDSAKTLKPSRFGNEESHENKWKKFWDHHRNKFRQRCEKDLATRNRSLEEMTTEVDAVFRKAIRNMRFDRSSTADESCPERDNKNGKGNVSQIVEKSLQQRSRLARSKEEGTFMNKIEEHDDPSPLKNSEGREEENTLNATSRANFPLVEINREGREWNENTKAKNPSIRKWSSLENLSINTRENSCDRSIEGLSIERVIGCKEKRRIESLRSSLERKMGSVERMLEDQIEKIWDEKVEKHPWLLPIDNWIVDRCRSSRKCSSTVQNRRNDNLHTEGGNSVEKERIEESFDSKFIASGTGDGEGRVEMKLIEHLKKPERSRFETMNLNSRLKRFDQSREGEVLEVKDVKHYDLLDKLRDNVKEKMEDIHRVDSQIVFFNFFKNIEKLKKKEKKLMTNRSLIKFLFLGESINGYNLYFKKNKIIMSIE